MRYESVDHELMKEVSQETGIPFGMVKDFIINGQSMFTKHIMETSSYDSVRWPQLGIFKLKYKYMMIKKHMYGMKGMYRRIFRKTLKYRAEKEREKLKKQKDEALQTR